MTKQLERHSEEIRLATPDGTYLVKLVEVERRRLMVEDDLIPLVAGIAYEAQQSVLNTADLRLGEKDVYIAFARRFLRMIRKDPKMFDDFLRESKEMKDD